MENWEDKLLNFFEAKISNGFDEGINNKIKLIRRIGYGVTNLKKFNIYYSWLSCRTKLKPKVEVCCNYFLTDFNYSTDYFSQQLKSQ
ncbi:hypothetical protein JCM15060_05810 [Halanaerobaculum tunisiense]